MLATQKYGAKYNSNLVGVVKKADSLEAKTSCFGNGIRTEEAADNGRRGRGGMSTVVLSPRRVRDVEVTSDWMIVLSLSLLGGVSTAALAIWWPNVADALAVMS